MRSGARRCEYQPNLVDGVYPQPVGEHVAPAKASSVFRKGMVTVVRVEWSLGAGLAEHRL